MVDLLARKRPEAIIVTDLPCYGSRHGDRRSVLKSSRVSAFHKQQAGHYVCKWATAIQQQDTFKLLCVLFGPWTSNSTVVVKALHTALGHYCNNYSTAE